MVIKPRYRVRNWKYYNKSLVNRGNLSIWFDEKVIARWYEKRKSGKRGRSFTYSRMTIECMSLLRAIFHLPLRATQGLTESLITFLRLPLTTPEYSTLSRRQKTLSVDLRSKTRQGNLHVLVDSTGLKVYGEGEWKVRQYGYGKRRTWRKLHLAIDAESHSILATAFTASDVHDSEVLEDLLQQIAPSIKKVTGDGAYDKQACYDSIEQRHARAVIPPRRDAKIKQHGNTQAPPLVRDENLREIRSVGRKQWKINHGYHRRSLVETMMFRFKNLFGERLQARLFENQATEVFIKCQVINRMIALGMPDSYAVT